MKTQCSLTKMAALAAALIMGALGHAQANEEDTNLTTIAYWKLATANSIALSPSGLGILDLATNTGQGITPPGTGNAPATVQDLWYQGPMASSLTFDNSAPPTSMFNPNNYWSPASSSWDCGVDEIGTGGSLTCDSTTYGTAFNGPDFTWECFFKSDTTNDPVMGTTTQFLIFDHHLSAYAFIDLNDNASNDTNQIGGIRFWGWNVAVFGIDCRITAAQNHGHRMDDGHWHYVAARFKTATETMDLLVVNDDGTSYETSTFITVPLNPGGSGSQGPVFLGSDENGAENFDGQLNQLRYSDASLPNSQLMANASGCNDPAFNNAPASESITEGKVINLSPASWPVAVSGGPLEFQWELNGTNIPGQTNLNYGGVAQASSQGTYQLVATTPCGGTSVTSAPISVTVTAPLPINLALWRMQSVATVTNNGTFVGIDDSDSFNGGSNDLITFNSSASLPGGISLTNTVPPANMFINGNNGGTNSFDASWIAGVAGALFYPQNLSGDWFDFQTSFTLELFFETYGDQSANGPMQLIAQGPDGGFFRYGLNINQAGSGAVSFKINNQAIAPAGLSYEDTNAGIQSVVLSDRNYADGTWHYLVAKYDSIGNTISLAINNQDGTGTNTMVFLPSGYSPLSASGVANMFIGRYRFGTPDDNRTFIGAINSVQVSSGLITPATGQLGYTGPPVITGLNLIGKTITIKFMGAPAGAASLYSIVGSATVNGQYVAVPSVVTALGGGAFQATLTVSGAMEFYKVKN